MGAMSSPVLNGFLDPATIARNAAQQQQNGEVTPEAVALNVKIQQLPAYQQYMQAKTSHMAGAGINAGQKFAAALSNLPIPSNLIFDPYTGQFRQKNWSERNSNWSALLYSGAAIGAGLGAGALVGGLAGAGAAGADVGAAATAPEAGAALLPSTTLAPLAGTLPSVAASGAVPAALGEGAAVAGGAGIGLGETGATQGLDAATQAGLPGAAAADGTLPSSQIGTGMIDNLPNVHASNGVAEGLVDNGSILGRIYKLTQGGSGSTLGDILGTAGAGVGAATQSAGNTQLQNAMLGLQANNSNIAANNSNISGNSAFENELMKRAEQEQLQRKSGLANIYRESLVENPRVSPFNPKGAPVYSDKYKSALSALSNQGLSDITAPRQYDSHSLPALAPYTNISTSYNPNTINGSGGTQPSTLQQIGNWAAPTLSTLGILSKYFNW